MSLEALFASLKIDDVNTVVEAVKKDGAEASGLAANITVLAARCDSADEAEALAAFKTVTQLCIECPQAQAFTKDCLSACKSMFILFSYILASYHDIRSGFDFFHRASFLLVRRIDFKWVSFHESSRFRWGIFDSASIFLKANHHIIISCAVMIILIVLFHRLTTITSQKCRCSRRC